MALHHTMFAARAAGLQLLLSVPLAGACGGQTRSTGAPESASAAPSAGVQAVQSSSATGTQAAQSGSTAGTQAAQSNNTAGAQAAQSGSTAGASGSAGQAATAEPASTLPVTFTTVKQVFGGGGGIMTCAAAPCHGINGKAPPDHPLELPTNNDALLYKNLTSYVSKACNNLKLVTPGKPAESALLTILKGPCGATPRMPYGCSAEAGDCIPDEYIQAVEQWVTKGAPGP